MQRRTLLTLPVAVAAGAALAVQARLNAELAEEMDAAVAGPALSLAGGTVILLVLAAVLPRMRAGLGRIVDALRAGRLRGWQLAGGIGGAGLVISQGLTVGAIGVAAFTVGVVAGQTTSSLAVDRAGIGPGGRRPVTTARLAGAVLTLAAVLLATSGGPGDPVVLGLAAIPLLAGIVIAWQQAVNARVNAAAGAGRGGIVDAALPATLVNFLVATVLLAVAAGVEVLVNGLPRVPPEDLLLYLGGPLGIAFVVSAATLVGRTGVLLFTLATVGGQLLGALVLDLTVPTGGGPPGWGTVAGTALAVLAVGVAAIPVRRSRSDVSG